MQKKKDKTLKLCLKNIFQELYFILKRIVNFSFKSLQFQWFNLYAKFWKLS